MHLRNRSRCRVQIPLLMGGCGLAGNDPVRTGGWSLPVSKQGPLVLGAPLGRDACVQSCVPAEGGSSWARPLLLSQEGGSRCASK